MKKYEHTRCYTWPEVQSLEQDGWELISVVHYPTGGPVHTEYLYFLKRLVSDQELTYTIDKSVDEVELQLTSDIFFEIGDSVHVYEGANVGIMEPLPVKGVVRAVDTGYRLQPCIMVETDSISVWCYPDPVRGRQFMVINLSSKES